jgi:serine/threonine protein kinase
LGDAARVNTVAHAVSSDWEQNELETSSEVETLVLLESVAAAGGFLNMSMEVDSQINKACESEIWSSELSPLFTERRVVGSGATACVWLGKDKTGTLVAIKVGKNSGGKDATAALASWTAECRDMQLLRLDACGAGSEVLGLHEQFIPTCTGVGPTKTGGAYYIMHAAGITGFKVAPEQDWDSSTRKKLFSSLVASLYAMHTVGQTHNDLHGQNIVVDDQMNMALIDFGELKPPEKSWVEGYKRDGNAVWRWAEVLAQCPQSTLWATSFDQSYLNPFTRDSTIECLQDKWGVDSDFVAKMMTIMNNGIDRVPAKHGIIELYGTRFIKDNLPTKRKNFPAEFADGCLSWGAAKLKEELLKKQFEDHVQCDTVPTFTWTKTSTKRGKTRTRKVPQCGGRRGACYTLQPSDGRSNVWMCDGFAITRGANCGIMDGACLMPSHEAYKYTKPFA